MNETAIEIVDFYKSYGTVRAVDGISFRVSRGEIFGLLGPNGAGKTTTLECLEGLRSPDAGSMQVMGIDPTRQASQLNEIIGVQLQTSGLPAEMTVIEALNFFSAYHGVSPSVGLLDRLGLTEKRNSQYQALSTGQKRRLALILAIAHDPPVVILDEPTAGLDVASRSALHDLMFELREGGTTILLATHDMAEAEKMTDRLAILLRGRIIAKGTAREITAQGSGTTKISVRTENSVLSSNEIGFPASVRQTQVEEYIIYFSTDPGPTVAAIIAYIDSQGDRLIDLRVERPSLEERFLEITNERD